MMPSNQTQRLIEFLHGPFDGHREAVDRDCETLPEELLCLVTANSFRCFDDEPRVRDEELTSIAIYQRRPRSGEWVYLFAGTISAQRIKDVCEQVGLSIEPNGVNERS